jgi:preprotein translocase subunit YajC
MSDILLWVWLFICIALFLDWRDMRKQNKKIRKLIDIQEQTRKEILDFYNKESRDKNGNNHTS